MKFKEGQRVIAVANGFNYGRAADPGGPLLNHDYAIGWKGTVLFLDQCTAISFDNGRVIRGCDRNSFEELKEVTMFNKGDKVKVSGCTGTTERFNGRTGEFVGRINVFKEIPYVNQVCFDGTGKSCGLLFADSELTKVSLGIGSKVTWDDKSYSLEIDNGVLRDVVSPGIRGADKGVYEITMTAQRLPGGNHCNGCPQFNDTIIRRISDQRVFFVQQGLLREYVVIPKFKQGQIAELDDEYCRIVKVNSDGTYNITMQPSHYLDYDDYIVAKESELTEVAQ